MRIVVTRVFQAWVKVAGQQISRTKQGILVLIGVTAGDTKQVAEHMALKSLNMRLWSKQNKNWAASVLDIKGDIMAVSQFTLYSILKGNKPDFHGAMSAQQAKMLYDHFVQTLRVNYHKDRVQTGKFQTLMEVGSVNNGPVTIIYDKNIKAEDQKQVKELQKSNKETLNQMKKQYSEKNQDKKEQIKGKKGQTKKQKKEQENIQNTKKIQQEKQEIEQNKEKQQKKQLDKTEQAFQTQQKKQ